MLPENTEAVQVFLAAQTQWRYAGTGGRTGLDYAALRTVMDLHQITEPRAVFEQVQVLERALLQVDREKAKAKPDAR